MEQQVEIPRGLQILSTQVAGHQFEKSLKSLGLLHDATKGFVYKPLGKPECGEREIKFYENLQKDSCDGDRDENTILEEARHFVPKFYYKLKLVVNQREYTFLKLEDLTCGLSLPCIMDIKIGKQTWDPLADAHKKKVEEQKYAGCKQVLGICIPGFQVYSGANTGEPQLVRHGKDFGKQLAAEDFPATMLLFLNGQQTLCVPLVRELLRQLYSIRDWFGRQTTYHFYASSLLVLYDFEQLRRLRTENTTGVPRNGHHEPATNGHHDSKSETDHEHNNKLPPVSIAHWVRVRMIDFAHVFAAERDALDSNYLFGLQHLISTLEMLLESR